MNSLVNRNLLVLVACQLISVSGTVLIVTTGGIIGAQLSGSTAMATLPVSLMVVGTALATVPAALSMQRFGRRRGFSLGLLVALVAMLTAYVALSIESFGLFCVATTLLGMSLAASQQYRFAAAESVSADLVSRAVSTVLIGSIGGAILAPELLKVTDNELAGGEVLLLAASLYVIALLTMQLFRDTAEAPAHASAEPRQSALGLLKERLFLTAVAAGVVGQGVMTLIMTATPISMHVVDGFSMADTSSVVRSHVLAMYVPSLFSGWLIAKVGLRPILVLGSLIMFGTVSLGLMGHEYMHYHLSMIALGIGWNFLFVGGTTLLVRTQPFDQRFSAQALNDFCVFGGSALASLLAGVLIAGVGWEGVLWVSVPVVAALVLLMLSVWNREPLTRVAA